MMTSVARGTPATPFDVTISVSIIASCWPKDRCTCAACATVIDASTRYSVDPSRLNEYPAGTTKLATRRGTPKATSCSSSLGSAASLLAVEKAVSTGSRTAFTNAPTGVRVRSSTGRNTSAKSSASAK